MQENEELLGEMKSLPVAGALGLDQTDAKLSLMIEAVEAKIRHMLNGPQGPLLQLLYKIDIDETKARKAFAAGTQQEIAKLLSALIIERMKQKAETRLKYRNNEL